MATNFKRKISMLLAIVMLVLCCNVSLLTPFVAYAAEASVNDHNFVAENDRYALYMNEEYLSIIVQDKVTGAYMESAISYDDGKNNNTWLGAMKSALLLTLIYSSVDTQQADLVNDDVTKKITYTDDGFSAEVYWTKYKLGMTLEVKLDDNGVVVTVPDESIIEDSTDYYIGTVSIYPYMGHSYLDSKEGYMFIPDGNGALIYLDDKDGRFSSGYSSMIYGTDIGFIESSATSLLWDRYDMVNSPNNILAPIYGMAFTEDQIAYLAVVEEGEERASIEANPNGVSVDYNRIHARFVERRLYTQPTSNNSSSGSFKIVESDRSHSDLQIRFIFLSGENANYCGMANAYRDYLLENGGLTEKEDSYRSRVDFLGTDREAWVIGTSAVVMTTVDDIYEIYEDLGTEGITDLFSLYKGWQSGGLYNIPISKYKADSKIGGTSALTELIKDATEQNISLYLYSDALRINPDEKNATFNIVKQVNKRRYEEETYKDVYEEFYFVTPARANTLVDKFMTSYLKKGVSNVAIAGVSNTLFSYNYSNKYYTRYDTAASYESMISEVDSQANLVLEQPYAYLWEYTDAFLDMPLYTSDYIYEDESIPFMSIVLKGIMPVYTEYVNFEANKQEFFLKMVESGSYPSFYITMASSSELLYTNSNDIYSSQYSVYRDTIVEYTNELRELNNTVADSYIVGHEILDNNVRVVTYDNGVKIYLNYANNATVVDGYSIEAMSYKVVE